MIETLSRIIISGQTGGIWLIQEIRCWLSSSERDKGYLPIHNTSGRKDEGRCTSIQRTTQRVLKIPLKNWLWCSLQGFENGLWNACHWNRAKVTITGRKILINLLATA